jgi:hypothetical protein
MSVWTLEVDLAWPPDSDTGAHWFERLLREVVDPLHRENVTVSGVRLVLKEEY